MFFIRNGIKTAVAPLRGRGLKQGSQLGYQGGIRRSLTGAWIETENYRVQGSGYSRRSLTGAWIETMRPCRIPSRTRVAPLRGRGLKRHVLRYRHTEVVSLPYGGVD